MIESGNESENVNENQIVCENANENANVNDHLNHSFASTASAFAQVLPSEPSL